VYTVKTPWWLPWLAPSGLVWKMPQASVPTVYLTFDDGPHPIATPFVLEQLQAAEAKGTFFCIGKCVRDFPDIFQRIRVEGHSVGNHTFNHVNGWKTAPGAYLQEVAAARELIPSRMFRPPYGRISKLAARTLLRNEDPWTIYMWSLLSGDFDRSLSPEKCRDQVLKNLAPGSIVVFHDSAKAWDRLRIALPATIEYCQKQGWALAGLLEVAKDRKG
jgi:peptidoglycan/xylan/chitin deacetylase (PgdA/CDA1 family)